MFDQQLDVFGGATDIAPAHRAERLFEPVRVIRGQTSMAAAERPRPAGGSSSLGRCRVKGCAHKTFSARGDYSAECPDHGRYKLERVFGEYSDHKCDARCTGATGPICDCSCGGHNHGRDHGR